MTEIIIITLQLTILALMPFKDKAIALHVRDMYREYGKNILTKAISIAKSTFFKIVSLSNKVSGFILSFRKKDTTSEATDTETTPKKRIRIVSAVGGVRKFIRRR